MNETKIQLICPERTILEEIKDKQFKRDDIAVTYFMCLCSEEQINWAKINHAIINRWSKSGLNYIKKLAWKQFEERETNNEG